MESLILLPLGLVLTGLGIANIRGNLRTIHWYHRQKVRQSDVRKYGKAVGGGTLILGIGLLLAFPVSLRSDTATAWILLPALILGIALILYGQLKYNRGLF